jgi:hypothetical protein
LGFFATSDQRKNGARDNRNDGSSDDFEETQGVCEFLVAPLVPTGHGDAKNFDLGRLQQQQKRLQVAAAGPGAILIDDHLAARLRETERACEGKRGDRKPK